MKNPEIIFENNDFVVINKPALLHSSLGQSSESVAQWIADTRPFLSELSAPPDFGLLQRLDFETSGIMLAAKTKVFERLFLELQKQGKVVKSYFAIVEGQCPKQITIDTPIGSRSRSAKNVRVITKKISRVRGVQEASTSVECLQYSPSSNTSLVKAKITKGARHQIRVHLASIDHPLVGDDLYGSHRSIQLTNQESNELIPGFALHSFSIEASGLNELDCINEGASLPAYFFTLLKEFKLKDVRNS